MPRVFVFALLFIASGCYRHARRDEPDQAPEEAASEMVTVPSGSFTMGDLNGEPDEYPERSVEITGFKMELTEVPNLAYKQCVSAKGCDPTPYLEDEELGKDEHPVVGVTWEDAKNFCKWIGRRLPTEAEWEYAAKGGDHRKWPWKGAFDPKRANTSSREDFHSKTAPVKSYENGVSPFGLINMAGNAAEWVADLFSPTYYRSPKNTRDPTGPTSGRERVVRGGSYQDTSHLVRVSARRPKLPTEADSTVGFRCASDQ